MRADLRMNGHDLPAAAQECDDGVVCMYMGGGTDCTFFRFHSKVSYSTYVGIVFTSSRKTYCNVHA